MSFSENTEIVINLLILLISCLMCYAGFFLGSRLRRHEHRLNSLTDTVNQHTRDIKELNTRVDDIKSVGGFFRRLFHKKNN